MSNFSERLRELMKDKNIEARELATFLNFSYTSIIYKWLRGEKNTSVDTAIKLADFLNCSLDYLFGITDDDRTMKQRNKYLPFDEQFKKVLLEQNVSQYKLLKDRVLSRGNLNNWFNKKNTPHIESVIKLANYLNVSLDYLVGREK